MSSSVIGSPSRRLMRRLALVLLVGLPAAAAVVPAARASTLLYDNTGNPANIYYGAQGGSEALDDLHLISAGRVDSLVFEYYDPASGGTFAASASFYRNPGGLDLDAPLLAGPFATTGLARGRGRVAIALPAGVEVGAHLWVGVRFTSATAGLILKSVPSVGISHDIYFENGGFYWFGGAPKANFGIRLVGISTTLSVEGDLEPLRVDLAPVQPNPFRGEATLRYTIGRAGPVRLAVYDLSGRRMLTLEDGVREAGVHAVHWSGHDHAGHRVSAGVYLVRLESAAGVALRKVLFVP